MFHPELRTLAFFLPRGLSSPTLVKLLKKLPAPTPKLTNGVTVREVALADRGTAKVRILEPSTVGNPRPAFLWTHGGGYVIGAASQDDALCARFAERLGATVISVDYRLAPEHPFPTPLEDCFAAWEWLHREASTLGIDPSRTALGGGSAGGGLAAALAQLIVERSAPRPRLQVLVYPMLDDRTVLRHVDDRDHRIWNPKANRLGWSWYLGREPGTDGVPHLAAPARRPTLEGLPPAWIGVGTCDLFHDEDVEYARRLREAGVACELEVVEGAFHGFDQVAPRKPVVQRFFDAQVTALTQCFAR